MPIDYEVQAATFDATRSASPTVSRLVVERLGPGAGRSLVDIAGGTGNYAVVAATAGFEVTVLDGAGAMVRRAAAKLGRPAAVGRVDRLPFGTGAFDAGILISALHQFPDQAAALAEARRVVRDGPFVMQAFTRENMAPVFVFDYFEGSAPPPTMHADAPTVAGWLRAAGFAEVTWTPYVYEGLEDGSLAALHSDPALLASEQHLANTSFFHRLEDDIRREGLGRLAGDLASGRLAERVAESRALAAGVGHGTVFAGTA
jgi:SAM-dependent methyltransferase